MASVVPRQPVPGTDTVRPRYSMEVREENGGAPEPECDPQTSPAPDAPNPPDTGPPTSGSAPAAIPRQAVPGFGVRARLWRTVARRLDDTLILVVLLGALVVRNLGRMPRGLNDFLAIRMSVKNVLLCVGFGLAWRLICLLCGLYDPRKIASWRSESWRVVTACLIAATVALAFPLTSTSGAFDLVALALFWAGATLVMLTMRRILRAAARVRPRPVRNVLIAGAGARARRMEERLQADPYTRYRVLGFIDSDPSRAAETLQARVLAPLEDFEATLLRSPADEVIVTLPVKSCYTEIQRIVDFCERIGVAVTLPADSFRSSRSTFRARLSPEGVALTLKDTPEGAPLVLKRALDIVGAAVALVVFSPLMALTVIAVKLTSRGPVLFAQERYGYNRRIFRMYKFRTMVMDAESLQSSLEHLNEAPGPLFKIERDPRLTPVGSILRRTSIDELPQLLNVLRGDMSLVGPRPMAIRDVDRFPETTLMRRFSVQAGMTGLWQVMGRSRLDFNEWGACDLRYVDEWSLGGDLRILARTIPVVLKGTGAQ